MPVATGFVVAAEAVSGFSIATTRLPADVRSVAIVLEPSARVDDERGDVVELGLSGATRAAGAGGQPAPPLMVTAGSRRISVFAVEPAKGSRAVEVTVASGEHMYLGGVLGAHQSAESFAESLSQRDLSALIGRLAEPTPGKLNVRWRAPEPSDRERVR
jgi:hypothetical protein